MDKDSLAIVGSVAGQIPFVIIGAIGLWLSVSRLRRHPRVSLWAALGFIAFIAHMCCRLALQVLVVTSASRTAAGAVGFAGQLVIWNLLIYLLLILAIVCLMRAIFVDREKVAVAKDSVQSPPAQPG